MTKMKGILLGAAAGLATVASAQAADLPVKAAPVEYVKVCSLYGAGFFYIPGTDTCLKIGGYLRSDHFYGAANAGGYFTSAQGGNANFPAGISNPVQQNLQGRANTDNYGFRARMNLTVDFRTQSDYGTIRAYAAIIGQQQTDDGSGTGTAGILRAFIQFAGFTVGHAVSYFDFLNGADYGYVPSTTAGMGATGVNGIDLVAYTWQIGNGFSTSVDIEDNNSSAGGRGKFIINASNNAQAFGNSVAITQFPLVPGSTAVTSTSLRGDMPDVVGNVRVDQAWGSAQIMGAIHNASGSYYSGFPGLSQAQTVGIGGTSQVFGHPGEAWGYSVGLGAKLVNFLFPRDQIEFQAGYCKGAIGYCLYIPNASNAIFGNGNTIGLGYGLDGVFTNGGQVQLSDSWAWAVGYQHYWNPQWRTGVLFGQSGVMYNSTASQMICGTAPGSNPAGQIAFLQGGGLPVGIGLNGLTNCSPNFTQESINVRTAWNPHPFLEIGLDLGATHLNTANAGQAFLVGVPNQLAGVGGVNVNNGVRPPGVYNVADQTLYYVALRFQKNILP
jgi:Porin subfamily